MKIVPAILTDGGEELCRMLELSGTFCDYVQIDVMDGEFVPSKSAGPEDLRSCSPDIGMEIHLMVKRPEEYIGRYALKGVRRIITHFESPGDPLAHIEEIRKLGLSAGLAINPETPVSMIIPLLDLIDHVLVMTVKPGFYGSPFLPDMLEKVRELSILTGDFEIGVDGGVDQSNLEILRESGANTACVGSRIFRADDPAKAYEGLVRISSRP
ncbi:MAG: ribulose-phosphate 3-epimerase [Chloroflexi bacterium]|nr:ribulose-phosphate 3-epimerase [Chloroflexota bacterium]